MTRFGSVRRMITRERSLANRASVLLVCVGLASLLRWALGEVADPVPFVTYFPAIVFCALFAGWQFGLASIALSAVVVNYFFVAPILGFATDARTTAMTVLFFGSCFLLVAIAQNLRRTLRELEAATERAAILNRELLHRGRNTLAIVQGLAQQTMRTSPAEFLPKFTKRVGALASAQETLLQGCGTSGDLHSIVHKVCAPFEHDGCFTIVGQNCEVPPDVCVPLSLALHELCTNAIKYGALSCPSGKVVISWDEPIRGRAKLIWEERGGPTIVPPSHKGLGSTLLTSHPQLENADLQFHPQGLRCEFGFRTAERI